MASRTGTEMYAYDLAKALMRRGHTPIVYSPEIGELGFELRGLSIPVVKQLSDIGESPHIIHGHHCLETMAAILRFPSSPAIFVCHDCAGWHDTPPVFPRLLRYIAVDYTCGERLSLSHGIPSDQIAVLYNGVDTERFKPRPPLPPRPLRAIVFSNYADACVVRAVREACDIEGISLDLAGKHLGGICDQPETKLREYDLVFAKGRCAREAAAVGCGVIVCDKFGTGPFVGKSNFDLVNERNFGRRLVHAPLNAEAILTQIRLYSATDAADVSVRLRTSLNMDAMHDDLIDLYSEVIDEFAAKGPAKLDEEARATASFLEWWAAARHQLVREHSKRRRLGGLVSRFANRLNTQIAWRWPRADRWLVSCAKVIGLR